MTIGDGMRRRALSGLLAFAMAIATVPVGAGSALASRDTGGGGATAFSQFKPAGPLPSFGTPTAQADLVNVRWLPGVTDAQIRAAAKRLGFSASATSRIGWAQLTPTGSTPSGTLARALREARLVTDAQPSVRMKAFGVTPNDPLFPSQWALQNAGQDEGTAGADISATQAWSHTTGSGAVVVAIVDTGVEWTHPDLKSNIWVNEDEIPNNGIDDDGNGYVDDVRGWDFRNNDKTVYDLADSDRHGTHVAGIIGAQGDNGIGISGLNQRVRMMPLKFIGGDGYGEDLPAANAIIYAVDNGATVINCSWGGGDSKLIKAAVDYAAKKGVILSVSAGNDYTNNDSEEWRSYPASYDTTNIVSVAASDRDDKLAEWSNYGEDSVDLAAPGVDVISTMPSEQAGFFRDTRTYKTVYLPVQAEVMEPAAARNRLIAGAVSQLGEATSTPILVVDDSSANLTKETQGARMGVYMSALSTAGFPNLSMWVTDQKGTPTQAAMDGKIVVWFTGKTTFGWYQEYCLNTAEQLALGKYLDAGGRLVLISGKAATDLQGFGGRIAEFDLISDYCGARWLGLEHWGREFAGRSTSRLADTRVTIPKAYTNPESAGKLWPTASDAAARIETGFPATAIMYTGQYSLLSGTSMAAPYVSGAIALLKAKYPASSPDELVARVLNTVDRKPAFAGKTVTGGRLNVAAAMNSYPGRVSITAPKKGERLIAESTSTLHWTPAVAGSPDATFTAQVGLPYTALSNGFEDGTLGTFMPGTGSGSDWAAATDTGAVHSGKYGAMSGPLPPSRPAPELGEGWYYAGMSSIQTTITVPEGGGDLTFYWRMPDSDGWDTLAWFMTDQSGGPLDTNALPDRNAWTKATYHLTAGERGVTFAASNYTKSPSDVRLYIDDITLTAHKFTSLGAAGAGETSLQFSVPKEATDDAWFRVQSHLGGIDSAWATVKGTRIVSDATAPAAPGWLKATPDLDGSIALAWGNPTDPDFDRVRVLASTTHVPTLNDTSATVVAEGREDSANLGPLVDGTKVHVSAWAVDTSGNWSPATVTETTAVDKTAPAPVSSLRVIQAQPSLPMVLWSGGAIGGNTATVLRSYTSTPTVGDRTAMALDAERGSATDWNVNPDAPQAIYTVYLTDPSGNTSAPRSVRANIGSKAIVGNISVESALTDQMTGSAIVETTTAWVSADVANATQMRVSLDGEVDPDADWVPFQPRFAVQFMPTQGQHTVDVELRNATDENVTVLSASALVVLREPLAPMGVSAKSWNIGVKVHWTPSADLTLASYRLDVGTSADGPWMPIAFPAAGGPVDESVYVAGLTRGRLQYLRMTAVDVLGRDGAPSIVVTATVGVGTKRFAGADRADTAAIASRARFAPGTAENRSDAIVIAPATEYVQALAANSLAGRLGSSVLVAGSTLSSSTVSEIERLGVHKAIVVGTSAAVSPAVDAGLRALGLNVERITGSDRYAVAAKVARRLSSPSSGSRDAFVVGGGSTADMCALMPLAYSTARPVIVVRKDSIPAAFKSVLAKTQLDSATIIGRKSAVSSSVSRQLSGYTSVKRISGANTAETAVKLANWAETRGLASWTNVSIANPSAWPQSLNIGAASQGGVVLLTSGTKLPSATASALRKNNANINLASIFGGTGSVSNSVAAKIRSAMSIPETGPIVEPLPPFDPTAPVF